MSTKNEYMPHWGYLLVDMKFKNPSLPHRGYPIRGNYKYPHSLFFPKSFIFEYI